MGRSRRERVVALTKTRKHMVGRDKKKDLVEEIRNGLDKYDHFYIFSIENQRNAFLKDLRATWSDSRFYFGRKSVMRIALGPSVEEEYLEDLHKMAVQLKGNVGLLLTNRSHESVRKFFDDYSQDDFARSGFQATDTFHISEGPLEHFQPNQLQNLRLIGLPVQLNKGAVTLEKDVTVCTPGVVLTPEKAKILELMNIKMAKFRVRLRCHFQKDEHEFQQLIDDDEEIAEGEDAVDH